MKCRREAREPRGRAGRLREWAGLHVEHSDEEIAQQDMHGDDQLIIPSECWPAVRTELAELLDTAESGGAAAARRWLESRGLHWIASLGHTAPCCVRQT